MDGGLTGSTAILIDCCSFDYGTQIDLEAYLVVLVGEEIMKGSVEYLG